MLDRDVIEVVAEGARAGHLDAAPRAPDRIAREGDHGHALAVAETLGRDRLRRLAVDHGDQVGHGGQHAAVLGMLEPLIRRGQKDGTFRPDVPADWHLSMVMALIHAASAEVRTGRMPDTDTEEALVTTVLGAVNARH